MDQLTVQKPTAQKRIRSAEQAMELTDEFIKDATKADNSLAMLLTKMNTFENDVSLQSCHEVNKARIHLRKIIENMEKAVNDANLLRFSLKYIKYMEKGVE